MTEIELKMSLQKPQSWPIYSKKLNFYKSDQSLNNLV